MIDFNEFSEYSASWRGYLVGARRTWHPYQRFALQGFRAGWIVASPVAQFFQFRRMGHLVYSLFRHGGELWAWGMEAPPPRRYTLLDYLPRDHAWGRSWKVWWPGTFSNSVQARRFRLFQRGPRRWRRRRRRRLAYKVTKERRRGIRRVRRRMRRGWHYRHGRAGVLPVRCFRQQRQVHRVTRWVTLVESLLFNFFRRGGWSHKGPPSPGRNYRLRLPREGLRFYRRRWISPRRRFTAWASLGYRLGQLGQPPRLGRGIPRGIPRPNRSEDNPWWRFTPGQAARPRRARRWFNFVAYFAGFTQDQPLPRPWHMGRRRGRTYRRREVQMVLARRYRLRFPRLRRRSRLRRRCPTRQVEVTGIQNFQDETVVPAGLVAGGLTRTETAFFTEVNTLRLPFIHFCGAEHGPRLTPWTCLWNQHKDLTWVLFEFLEDLYHLTHQKALLNAVAARLSFTASGPN